VFCKKYIKGKRNDPKSIMWLFVGENSCLCVKIVAFLRIGKIIVRKFT